MRFENSEKRLVQPAAWEEHMSFWMVLFKVFCINKRLQYLAIVFLDVYIL